MPVLAEVQEAFLASILTVPFHRPLRIEMETRPTGNRVVLPVKPEIMGPHGTHSPAAVYALGDTACSIQVCEEIAVRALELEMGAIFLTGAAEFQRLAPARGRIEAVGELLKGLDADVGKSKTTKK